MLISMFGLWWRTSDWGLTDIWLWIHLFSLLILDFFALCTADSRGRGFDQGQKGVCVCLCVCKVLWQHWVLTGWVFFLWISLHRSCQETKGFFFFFFSGDFFCSVKSQDWFFVFVKTKNAPVTLLQILCQLLCTSSPLTGSGTRSLVCVWSGDI